MNCNEFELIVIALARKQLMDTVENELSLVHAEGCGRCAGRLASERFLIAGARAVIAAIAAEEAPARVEAALLAAFHEHTLITDRPAVMPISIKMNSWSFWRPVAVAALILISISTVAVFWSYSNSLNQGNEELTGSLSPVELPAPVVAAVEPGSEIVKPSIITLPNASLHRRISRPKSNKAEEVTEFYPLIEGEDLDTSEVTQVVRVELPASALSAAGLSIGSDVSTVPIKADVALGYDGLARAIRFIR
jgi:hypothetical protein